MSVKLPDIDVDAISSLDEAKQIIVKQLLNIIEQQAEQIKLLEEQVILLEKEIALLKQQPHKPQFTSSQSSSFSASKLLKEKGKHWHKLSRAEIEIDQDVQLPEVDRCICGSVDFTILQTTTKIVQGMIIKRNNTAYHGKKKKCLKCGEIYKPEIPADLRGLSFDNTTQSIASFLKFACRFTHPLLYNFLTGFGMKISYGQITEMLQRNSRKLHQPDLHLKNTGIKQNSYLHSDATGTKRKQQVSNTIINQHLHFLGNKFLSLFKITMNYNSVVLNQFLGKHGRRKLYVSDDGSPNGSKLRVKRKQLCWIHEDRHYLKLSPRLNMHKEKLQTVINQLLEFYHLAKEYGRNPTASGKKELREMFDTITRQKTGYNALDHQLTLTNRKRDRLLLFLDYPFLPIQNNQAEQDIREFVVMRKISGETKSLAGDRSIERHISVIQTARKQGLNVYETLHGLLTGQLSPAVLTAKFV